MGNRAGDWSAPVECLLAPAGSLVVTSQVISQHAGNDDAFRRFVVPELDVLLRVARRLTGEPGQAEDLVQETLIRAYRAIERFDERHPRAWLLTIMRNNHLNMLRRRRPRIADYSEERLLSAPARGADGRGGAEEHVVDATFEAAVAAALQQLPPKMRAVVALVDIDGLSYREVATTLGVPEGTVMSVHRARARLRSQLEEAGFGPGRGKS